MSLNFTKYLEKVHGVKQDQLAERSMNRYDNFDPGPSKLVPF